ncbi:OPT-domain-containing protein [Mycena crocata]|nr:OPT-domain-containing protein [Mycena crocata]
MEEPRLAQKSSSESVLKEEKVSEIIDVDVLADDIQAITDDLLEAADYARTMTPEEVDTVIHRIVEEHGDDPNFPPAVLDAANRYLFDADLRDNAGEYRRVYDELKVEAAMMAINSPYAEVRAVVDNHDDTRVPVEQSRWAGPVMLLPNTTTLGREEEWPKATAPPASTFRTWVIGTVYVAVGAFINQFFSIRYPNIFVGTNVAQILAVPFAKLMELLPETEFTTFGYTWSMNPGPFNPKEHMLITIMANVGFSTPYTANIIWVQYLPLYFNQSWALGFGYQILVALSTNLIGYGLAGLTRRFLVYPAHAIWPLNLATIALNRAFHHHRASVANGWTVTRLRWFLYCFCGMFVYFWFPDFIFQATTFNIFLGATITLPIIAALWFTNTWNSGYLPINSNLVFDNTGNLYSVADAIGADTLFNQTMYENYSPAYLSASNALLYGVFFAVYTATLSHAFLYHRRDIVHGFRSILSRGKTSESHTDVHVRLMESYKEVPEWQYFLVLVFAIVVGAIGIGVYPTHTSPAVVLYGVFLAMIFVIPVGIIASITNVEITLNVLAEMFGGLWFPGNATYGFITSAQTISFAQDLKFAHYMHIPPRLTFWAQIYATIISSFVCTGILNFQMTKIADVCTPDQKDHFTCPDINTFFTASVLWGSLGPKRMFGAGGIYNGLLYFFLIGAILPFPVYFLRKRFKVLEYLHIPVLLTGGLSWAPYTMANLWPAVPVGYLFNVFIKRRYIAWWSKYNYVTTSAFSAAIAIAGIVIFFAVEWPSVEINWSGNMRPFDGCDASGCARLPLPDSGFFGPGPGEFR